MRTTALLISAAVILDVGGTQGQGTQASTSKLCNEKLSIMGVNVLNNGSLLSTCSKGTDLSVSNVSEASKLPKVDLQRICSTPACLKPFEDLESSDLKSCLVTYDNKDQNLADIAKTFVTLCKGGDESKKSDSEKSDSDKIDSEKVVKADDKGNTSGAVMQSLSLIIAVTSVLLAFN
uniref:Elicitin n=1 Tax=Albugo laibachii Nc14 TaxID=890382 RepID=F0WGN1_9STRA|nr:AlNc14C92G5759 [Albugo laibachii Nc14]|eukprot:CCA20395.1 AlNc14C92G5759 [Albugo laibachii Nc14]